MVVPRAAMVAGLAAAALVGGTVLLAGCSPASATIYYVSAAGSNQAAGTSPSTAWRSLARVTAAHLQPGSTVLLRGGDRFAGQLKLGPRDAGNPRDLVRIGSYGTGRATIEATEGSGLVIYDTAGVSISNLTIVGSTPVKAASAGIQVYSTLTGRPRLDRIDISRVDVSGFGTGIAIGAAHSSGFSDVRVDDSVVHGNMVAGLASYGPAFSPQAPAYPNTGIVISHVTAYANRGDPANTTSNTGDGIVLGGVDDASVVWSTAYDNGGDGGSRREGPEGIWAYDSRDVLIEHDVSYQNKSGSTVDGGGFGFDENTAACTMQYNLAYGNYGSGILLYGIPHAGQSGSVVRFNISSDNANTPGPSGGIQVLGFVADAAIYQNTVVVRARPGSKHAAIRLGANLRSVTIRNNVLVVDGQTPVVLADVPLRPAAVMMQGNDYFAGRRPWTIVWGHDVYSSLPAWRAGTSQEVLAGKPTGYALDPRFAGPAGGSAVGSASGAGSAFALRSDSPLRRAGLDLARLFGVRSGDVSFSGDPMPETSPDIGAL